MNFLNIKVQPIIGAYFEAGAPDSRAVTLLKTRTDIPFDKVNLIYIGFINMNYDKTTNKSSIEFGWPTQQPTVVKKVTNLIIEKMQAKNPGPYAILASTQSSNLVYNDPDFPTTIVKFLTDNNFNGLDLDIESNTSIIEPILKQLAPAFNKNNLILSVSVYLDPINYGDLSYADLVGVQNYGAGDNNLDSFKTTMTKWKGFLGSYDKLLGGISSERCRFVSGACTQNDAYTSSENVRAWSRYAIGLDGDKCLTLIDDDHKLKGMFSWRLDNDNSRKGEDVNPTFAYAKLLHSCMKAPTKRDTQNKCIQWSDPC